MSLVAVAVRSKAGRNESVGAANALALIASEANRNPQALDAMRTFFQVAADMGLVKAKVNGPSIDASLSLNKRNQSLSPFHSIAAVPQSDINDGAVVRHVKIVPAGTSPDDSAAAFPQPIVAARTFMGSGCLYVAGLDATGRLYVVTVTQRWKSGMDVQNIVALKYVVDCRVPHPDEYAQTRLFVDESAKLILVLVENIAQVVFLGEEGFGYGPEGSATVVTLVCRDKNASAYPILNRATNATAIAFHSDVTYYRAVASLGETPLAGTLAVELAGVDTMEATFVAAFGWVFRTPSNNLGFARLGQAAVYSRALSDASLFQFELDGVRTAASPDGDRDSTIMTVRIAADATSILTGFFEIVSANGELSAGQDASDTGSGLRLVYITEHYVVDGPPNAHDVARGPVALTASTRVARRGAVATIDSLPEEDARGGAVSGDGVILAVDWWGETIVLARYATTLEFHPS